MSVPHIDPAQAIQKMDAGEALVVDVRQPDEHELQRIPGSLLLPLDDINAESAARVLPDKNALTSSGSVPKMSLNSSILPLSTACSILSAARRSFRASLSRSFAVSRKDACNEPRFREISPLLSSIRTAARSNWFSRSMAASPEASNSAISCKSPASIFRS